MPWKTRKRGNKYCVVKEDDGSVVPGGCHASKEEAEAHRRAIEANYEGDESAAPEGIIVLRASPEYLGAIKYVGRNGMTTAEFTSTMGDHAGTFILTGEESDTTGFQPFMTFSITAAGEGERSWDGGLAVEGALTEDTGMKRYMLPGSMSWRDLPIPLMLQTQTQEGHIGAVVCGRIDAIARVGMDDFDYASYGFADKPEGSSMIVGYGVFDSGPDGQEAARLVEAKMLRGISVDLADVDWSLLNPETYEPMSEDDYEEGMDIIWGAKSGVIAAATLLPVAAFADTRIQNSDTEETTEAQTEYGGLDLSALDEAIEELRQANGKLAMLTALNALRNIPAEEIKGFLDVITKAAKANVVSN